MLLKPTTDGVKLLKRKGKLSTKVSVAYTPASGSARSTTVKVTLKKKLRKKH